MQRFTKQAAKTLLLPVYNDVLHYSDVSEAE